MKTWEMIKELTEDPKKNFVSETSTPTTAILEDGFIEFFDLLGNRFSHGTNVNIEWKEVKQPVSFMEAIDSGKRIRVEHKKTDIYPDFREFLWLGDFFHMLQGWHSSYNIRDILLNGKFYIED